MGVEYKGGNVYRLLKQCDNSLNDLNRSLEIEPNNARALSIRANTHAFLEQYDDALKDVDKALEL